MAGHSKWHNIKHKKAAQDQKRGKIFTKVMREIEVAVRQGGPNPENNPRLRLAIEMAKSVNMPKDNVFGGSLAEAGSVSWIFERKGVFAFSVSDQVQKEKIADFAIENGAEDINDLGDTIEVYCDPKNFEELKGKFEQSGFSWERAEVTFIPKNTVKVSGKEAETLMKLMNALDDHDDVQRVWANFEIEDQEMEKLLAVL
jgi:transcriptional/translational regulatory protein YebC/TACO1